MHKCFSIFTIKYKGCPKCIGTGAMTLKQMQLLKVAFKRTVCFQSTSSKLRSLKCKPESVTTLAWCNIFMDFLGKILVKHPLDTSSWIRLLKITYTFFSQRLSLFTEYTNWRANFFPHSLHQLSWYIWFNTAKYNLPKFSASGAVHLIGICFMPSETMYSSSSRDIPKSDILTISSLPENKSSLVIFYDEFKITLFPLIF